MIARLLFLFLFTAAIAGAEIPLIERIRAIRPGFDGGMVVEEPKQVPAPDLKSARILWNNLESLPGELGDATATELSWKSPLFEEPLRLRWDAIRRIDQTLPAAEKPADSFHVILRDGSHLLGELGAITADSVALKTARHGDVTLKRSEILRLVRRQGAKLVAGGPSGDVGWELQETKRSGQPSPVAPVPRLVTGPGGALVMPYWNTAATFAIEAPDRVEIEMTLLSSEFPEFSLRFDGDKAKGVHIETWDDELVVAHDAEFQSVRKIGGDEREISLRICWDRKAKTGSVFTASGQPLAQWKFSGDFGKTEPWALENKGRDLTLTRFIVREWSGQAPATFDASRPRVALADGRVLSGEVTGAADGVLKVSGESADIPIGDLAELVFSSEPPKSDDKAPRFAFTDGTICHGRIASIADGRAAIETAFANAPLAVSMSGLRQLRVTTEPDQSDQSDQSDKADPPAKPAPLADQITIDGTVLHGSLASTGGDRLAWLPVGGVKPSAPVRTASLKVTRALPPNTAFPAAPALFYTAFGDIIPGTFRGLANGAVEIESGVVETKTLPVAALDAVQFGAVTQANVQGFDGPGWRILKGDEKTVRVGKDGLEMEPETAFGHASLLQTDEIRFSIDAQDGGTVRLRLFAAGTDPARTTNVVISGMGGNIYAGWEQSEGQLANYNNVNAEPGKPAAVRILIKENQVAVSIAGNTAVVIPFDPKKRPGSGLIFEPASIFGNDMNTVKLTGFSAPAAPGRTWLPEINPEVKSQALTVPRFRKERPPRHALIAMNGDVLRGEIEATTATHFGFRAGLENLRIPRDRVNAAVWLKPPRKEGDPAPAETSSTEKLLGQPMNRNVRYSGASLNTLLSALRREAPGLNFKTPSPADRRRVMMSLGGQTVGEALAEICRTFGLRSRIEEDGTIALEPGDAAADEFVRKVYWLKADAFPSADAAQAHLGEDGVEFPPGANAEWNAGTRQLTVRHTAAGQAQVAGILEKEFGAKVGTLTHWVMLADGARLGLQAEKFDPDFILGRHPEYGRCRIPMPLIVTIQTSQPEGTEVMRAFADWHLEPAREPVLPESGGESSELLGKQAAAFKIPMLDGGEFDLEAEKGKVVVLDFWATWCAPCIKALPGLIEALGAFPEERVKFIGVNQSEPVEAVKRFIETRKWSLAVALDADQKVAQQYGVTGIPHTVIVGPDGKIAWVKTGYSPDGAAEAAAAVEKLLAP